MSNVESLKDIQARLRLAFKLMLVDLRTDDSQAGQNFLYNFGSFLVLPHPKIQDLLDLEEKIYTYKLQLNDHLRLKFAADYLLLKVQASIREIKIGYGSLQYSLNNEKVNYYSQTEKLNNFKYQLGELNGEGLNVINIANIIVDNFTTNADAEILDGLILDFYYYLCSSYKTVSDLQNSLINIQAEDAVSILDEIYNILNYKSISTSPIAKGILASLKQYLIDHRATNVVDIVNIISNEMPSLGSSMEDTRSYAITLCQNIGCQQNIELLDLIEVSLILLVTNNSFSMLRKNFIDHLGEDVFDNNAYAFVAGVIKEINGDFFANAGPYSLFLTINNYLLENQGLNINDLVSIVKASYSGLEGIVSYNVLAYNTANLFLTSQVTDLATKLMLDFSSSGYSANDIVSGVMGENNFVQKSDLNNAKFVMDFYDQSTNFIGFGGSSKALLNLVEAIDNCHENSNKDFSAIVSEISYLSTNSEEVITQLQLAEIITNTIDANELLAQYLEFDFYRNYPGNSLQNNIGDAMLRIFYNLVGNDALSIATSLYSSNILDGDYIRNNEVIYNPKFRSMMGIM